LGGGDEIPLINRKPVVPVVQGQINNQRLAFSPSQFTLKDIVMGGRSKMAEE